MGFFYVKSLLSKGNIVQTEKAVFFLVASWLLK